MQFDCARCDELLLDFEYGELDEVTAAAFRRHAESCARCGAALADVRTVRDAFSMLSLETPSPTIDARILAAADQRLAAIDETKRAAQRHESRSFVDKLFDVFRVAALRPQYAMAVLLLLVVGVGLLVAPNMRMSEQAAPGAAPTLVTQSAREAAPLPVPVIPMMPAPPPVATPEEGAAQTILAEPADGRAPSTESGVRADAAARPRPGPTGGEALADRDGFLEERSNQRQRAPVTLAVPEAPAQAPQRMLTRGGGGADGSLDEDDEAGRLGFAQRPSPRAEQEAPARSRAVDAPRERRASEAQQRESAQHGWAVAPAPSAPTVQGGLSAASPSPPSSGGSAYGPTPSSTGSFGNLQQQQSRAPAANASGDVLARGMSNYQAGQYRRAIPDLEAAVQRPGMSQATLGNAYLAIARSYYRLQSFAEAARRYEELMSRFGYRTSADVNWEAAECYRALGNTQRADQLYQVAERSSAYAERARARRVQMDGARRAARAYDAAESVEPAEPAGASEAAH